MEPMTDTLMSELRVPHADKEMIMVVGVGGAGCNAVGNMWHANIKGISYMACNTDQKSLDINPVDCKIRLGEDGLGAGNRPERGRAAAITSLDDLRFQLKASGCRMVFIAAGMGGGTGTGAAPVIAALSREMGLLTVGIVTSPLASEGRKRWRQAMEAIAEMEKNVDALLVIDNDNIVRMYDDLPLREAFSRADNVLATAARGIAEIVTRKSDLVGVDFADVSEVMRNCGRAHMSVTSASGEDRVEEVIRSSLCSPLLGQTQIAGAKNILINFSTSDPNDLKAGEMKQVLDRIQQYANGGCAFAGLSDTNVIWGTSVNKEMEPGILELVIIATGFEVAQPQPAPIPALVEAKAGTADSGQASAGEIPAGEDGGYAEQNGDAASGAVGELDGADDPLSGEQTPGVLSDDPSAKFWSQLTQRITVFVEKFFEGGEDTPLQ